RIEPLVFDHQLDIGQMTFDASREQVEVVGDGFERVVDFVREADCDLARGRELLAMAHHADIARETDATRGPAVLLVDDRPGDRDRYQFVILAAQHGLEVRDAPGVLARLAHRLHHAARLLERRIDGGDFLPDDLLRGITQILSRAVIVENYGAIAVNRDDDIGRSLYEALKIILIQ